MNKPPKQGRKDTMGLHLTLVGYVGKDPTLNYTKTDDKAVSNFSVAVKNGWRKDEQGDSETLWVECTVWGATAEIVAEYVKKGTLVSVYTNNLFLDEFEKRDGTVQVSLKCDAQGVDFFGGKDDDEDDKPRKKKKTKSRKRPPPPPPPQDEEDGEEDLDDDPLW